MRRWLESLDYRLHRTPGVSSAAETYDRLRSREGLDPFRKVWWPHSRLESYRCLRRYALLLDCAVDESRGQRAEVGCPSSAFAETELRSSLARNIDRPTTSEVEDPDRRRRVGEPGTKNQEPRTKSQIPAAGKTLPASRISYPVSPIPPHARVVVLRMGHLGDLLHLMPTVREIKRQRPDLRLELVTGTWNRELAARFREWDKIHEYAPDVLQYHRGQRRRVRTMRAEREFLHELRAEGVQMVFCPTSPHFAELPLVVGLQPSLYVGGTWPIGEAGPFIEKHTRPFNSRELEMDSVAACLPLMGLEAPDVSLYYDVGEESRVRITAWLCNPLDRNALRIAMFPGSGWPGKNWPPERFTELGRRLASTAGARVEVVGSPAERALCASIAAGIGPFARSLAGELTLDESAALIEECDLLIGNDSFPIHLAAALGVPTVSLWGPTFPEKWGPRGPRHAWVRSTASCDGCVYWHPGGKCLHGGRCMQSISVEQVEEATRKVLEMHGEIKDRFHLP